MNLAGQAEGKREPHRDIAFCSLCLCAVIAFYTTNFIHLFPLSEFREWIAATLSPEWAKDVATQLVLRDRLFSRDISLMYSVLSGWIGGVNIQVINALVLVPVFATCLALYILCRQLHLTPFTSLSAVWLWAFSLPVVDAIAWQATINDRLALLFSLVSLNATLAALHNSDKIKSLLWGNGVALPCLIMAYNSKESAFFLGPSILILLLLHCKARKISVLSKLLPLSTPLAYGTYHNMRYFQFLRGSSGEAWSEHVMGGGPLANWELAARHVLGLDNPIAIHFVAATWFAITALTIYAFIKTRKQDRLYRAYDLLWLSAALAMAIAITLQTTFSLPFYQYVPRALIAILLTSALEIAFRGFGAHPRIRSLALVILLATNSYVLWTQGMPLYLERLELANNFTQSFHEIQTSVDWSTDVSIKLVTPLPLWKVYLFYTGPEHALYRFIFPKQDSSEFSRNTPVQAQTGVNMNTWTPMDPKTYYICYSNKMKIIQILFNEDTIFAEPQAERALENTHP